MKIFYFLLFALLAFQAPAASAQEATRLFEGTKIRWVVPYRPGGSFDSYSRLLAPFLAKHTGAQVDIVNLPGTGSLKGTLELLRSPADGLHVGIINAPALLGREIALGADAGHETASFSFLGRIATEERVMIVSTNGDHADSPMSELVTMQLKIGATGIGGSSFLDAFVSNHIFDAPWRLISGFDSSSNVRLALLRGDIDAMWASYTSVQKSVAAGDAKIVLRAGVLDIPQLDGTTTAADLIRQDAGLMKIWQALSSVGRPLVAPPNLPPDQLVALRSAMKAAITDPEFLATAADAKRPVAYLDGPTMQQLIESTLDVDDNARALLAKALGGSS